MELTIGMLEDKLRKFSKGVAISVTCNCCHHGAIGDSSILSITDKTNQTYGYIELNLNDSSQSDAELSHDKEEFYKKEVEKLNKIIKTQIMKLERYEEYIDSNIRDNERIMNHIKYLDKMK